VLGASNENKHGKNMFAPYVPESSRRRVNILANECMIVVGTRPEIIKMAPIIRALKERSLPYVFVHCGQHYDYNMSQQFIEELELPAPKYGFKVRAYSPGLQTGRILTLIERVIKKVEPKSCWLKATPTVF